MTALSDLKKEWMKEADIQKAYEDLTPEFSVARTLISARVHAGLTQAEVAERMGTSQSVVARLEGGKTMPSLKTLFRFAKATGTKPVIDLIPVG